MPETREQIVARVREALAHKTDDAFVCDLVDGPFKADERWLTVGDIRALLAAPQGEPVAWRVDQTFEDGTPLNTFVHLERERAERVRGYIADGMMYGTVTSLYAAAPVGDARDGPSEEEVWSAEACDYDSFIYAIYRTPEDALAAHLATYGPPYVVRWEDVVKDEDGWTITGHFEWVPGYSTKHTATTEFKRWPVQRRTIDAALASSPSDGEPPKPVAWRYRYVDRTSGKHGEWKFAGTIDGPNDGPNYEAEPLYAHPPRSAPAERETGQRPPLGLVGDAVEILATVHSDTERLTALAQWYSIIEARNARGEIHEMRRANVHGAETTGETLRGFCDHLIDHVRAAPSGDRGNG
jgi:hypothetical protein